MKKKQFFTCDYNCALFLTLDKLEQPSPEVSDVVLQDPVTQLEKELKDEIHHLQQIVTRLHGEVREDRETVIRLQGEVREEREIVMRLQGEVREERETVTRLQVEVREDRESVTRLQGNVRILEESLSSQRELLQMSKQYHLGRCLFNEG